MSFQAFISGCAGLTLSEDERAFFRDARPCGLILFGRNCDTPDQIRGLIADFHAALGDERALVLVDQEGGPVQRLRPPHWRRYPAARAFGRLYGAESDADAGGPERALKAAHLVSRLMAAELAEVGITVNCLPVLDLPVPDAHEVIGERAYATEPEPVIALARAVAEAHLEGGVLPVVKHIPGHGRAGADSHESLPVIEATLEEFAARDLVPFAALNDLPLAMTAHVMLPALDPEHPASLSEAIMRQVIRDRVGFSGLVMSDDVSMGALSGPIGARAAAIIAAGSDVVLHCNGVLAEMREVAEAVPRLEGTAEARFAAALARRGAAQEFDTAAAEAALSEVWRHA